MSVDPAKMLHAMLSGADEPGYLEFRFRAEDQWQGPHFINTAQQAACLRLMRMEHSSVGAIPRRRPEQGHLARANVLWVRCETAKHAEALARFRPAPTLVLREGKSPRRVAFWALAKPLKIHHAEQANKRIAHRIGAKKKWADPEFEFHPVSTTLVLGAKPVAVWAEYADPGALFLARGVVHHLDDPPAAFDWKKERAAA